ncbi:hypothetical protein F4560_001020 [Saccharothrix ecbatanensis]|uniref:Uncharacterized protein n=1 Tax=Saccharothrix ecbatanensis TaxID=1105145 RepID=A0A7W9LZ23_9PSEU|nr:hypothetical protein [Saccharothrix ecbatanensis]MBB5801252.1 hypothetical protein [Saccharothrix ecbatanensis]
MADFKISLHPATGHGQYGLSDTVRAQVRPGDRQALSRWQLSTDERLPGWTPWYILQFPESELVDVPVTSSASQVIVDAPPPGMSIHVLVLVSGPGVSLPVEVQDYVIATLSRANGGSVALVTVPSPFDPASLTDVAQPPVGLTPWAIPGLQGEPEPFGWIVDAGLDGTRRSTEYNSSARAQRTAEDFSFPDFPGRLVPWDEKPDWFDDRGLLCALLLVPVAGEAQLFIDFRARCNHQHLAGDALQLVEAARSGQLDHGWSRLANGDLWTGISTARVLAELGGMTEDQWAVGPGQAQPDDEDPGV